MRGSQGQSGRSFDREKWDALLKYDDLLADVVRRLKPLGDYWIEELAASYLAINDKAYLPIIVQKIIAGAKAQHEKLEREKAFRRKRLKIIFLTGAVAFCCLFCVAALLSLRANNAGFDGIYEQYRASQLGYYTRADWDDYQRAEARRRVAQDTAAAAAEEVKRNEEIAQQTAAEQRRVKEEGAQKAAEAVRKAADQAKCALDLNCLGEKFFPEATVYCKPVVERLAKNNFEWTDGWLEPKFSHYRWKNKTSGVITYIGDKIKYQNGFGAWVLSIYECDFDTQSKSVIDVRASPGRL